MFGTISGTGTNKIKNLVLELELVSEKFCNFPITGWSKAN